jgi:hypothetical protein
MPGSEPPADVVDMEVTLREHIRDVLLTVPYLGHVHIEPQFIDDPQKENDIAESKTKVADPVMGDKQPFINYIEIGLPTIEVSAESGGSDEEYIALYITYPMALSLGVVAKWEKDGFPFTSSAQMVMAIYLRAQVKFKQDRSLGFTNVVTHYYLQLVGQDEAINDEGEVTEYLQDWELKVRVQGKY